MTDIKIQIEGLYKVFGSQPQAVMPQIREGISKQDLLEKHQHVLGLKDINIQIPAQKISVIMGLSGSGKSTLIRHINRLIEPTEGRVLVDGQDVLSMSKTALLDFRRHKASMVFQHFGLHVHKTVAENVAYGLVVQGVSLADAKAKSNQWLQRVGLSGFEDHYPAQLSGGMQQRVGLARALATDADILLMDEAFSALDPLIRSDMQSILLDLQQELHRTIVFITHDLDEALRIGESIAILRDGEVIQQGDPQQIIMRPHDDYIVDFVQDVNRGRVIKASTLMTPNTIVEGPDFPADWVLERALPILVTADSQSANLVDHQGKIVGSLSLTQAIDGLVRVQADGAEEVRYR